ncbi:MAG TPA: hypothetical protein VFF30_05695 [Nitrososphaerales archaeon]|nr:hypothetical protein [Nitrososphaerales archaeon]
MRIATSRTLRSIDNWRQRLSVKNQRFVHGVSILLLALGSTRNLTVVLLALLIFSISVEFAAVQFGSIVLLGFFMLKLRFYRLSNVLLLN